MNYYGGKELAGSFRTVRNNTITIARDLPEDTYGFRPAPGWRTPAELLSHIAVASGFQYQLHGVERRTDLAGFDFPAAMQRMAAEEKIPRSKDEVIALLESRGDAFAAWLEGLTDEFLAERIQFPAGGVPPSKSRFEMIMGVKEHEMHHRGQLMLIERLVGVVPHLTRAREARNAAPAAK